MNKYLFYSVLYLCFVASAIYFKAKDYVIEEYDDPYQEEVKIENIEARSFLKSSLFF